MHHLVQLVIPNMSKMPKFAPKEIQHFFEQLGYTL